MSKEMAGLKNTAAKRRGQDGGKLGEGNCICEALAKDKDISAIFNSDLLTIQFAHTKSDMSGARAWHKSHIFANPDRHRDLSSFIAGSVPCHVPPDLQGSTFPGCAQ
jgi:hypothetical protein